MCRDGVEIQPPHLSLLRNGMVMRTPSEAFAFLLPCSLGSLHGSVTAASTKPVVLLGHGSVVEDVVPAQGARSKSAVPTL